MIVFPVVSGPIRGNGHHFILRVELIGSGLATMTDVGELVNYARMVRRRFAEKLSTLPADVVEKNMEASFYSMKNVLLHMIDNEDWIVNYVITGRQDSYVRRKWESYANMGEVTEHMHSVESGTDAFFQSIDDAALARVVVLKTSAGKEFRLSVEECLLQSFTEQLYHMGELIALLWQQNIEPPPMQWFYNNPRAHD